MKFNLGSITDALFEKDPNATEKHDSTTPTPVATSAAPIPAATPVPVTAAPIPAGAIDPTRVEKFVTSLRGKLAASPTSATIASFFTIAESLAEAIPDEGGRFRAALKTLAKTQNITQQQLADAFTTLIGVLDGEVNKTASAIQEKTAKEVTARENSIDGINKQIEDLSKQRDQLATAVIEQRNEIGLAQSSFATAVSTLKAEINDSLNKLRIYSPITAPAASTASK
jgi:hypothetical protein